MQINTTKGVGASTVMTEEGSGMSKESKQSAVLSVAENVTKDPMDSVRAESLVVETTAPPPATSVNIIISEAGTVSGAVENLVDSGQHSREVSSPAGTVVITYSLLSGYHKYIFHLAYGCNFPGDSGIKIDTPNGVEAFSAMTEKGAAVPMESEHSAVQSVVENVTKEPMDGVRMESLLLDTTRPAPERNINIYVSEAGNVSGSDENLVESGQLTMDDSHPEGIMVLLLLPAEKLASY